MPFNRCLCLPALVVACTCDCRWFWTETDWMLEFTQHVASLPDGQVPDTFSISWGWWEGEWHADQCKIRQAQQCMQPL